MPRPTKCRWVGFMPAVTYFKPAGIPLRLLKEVSLSVEEVEAIRLKDIEGLEQEECAERMKISRPTFHRVLGAARRKLADALLNGKAIRIGGGNFMPAWGRFRCLEGHEWDIPPRCSVPKSADVCPRCGSRDIQALQDSFPGRGWRHGWGRGVDAKPSVRRSEPESGSAKEMTDEDSR